MTAKLPGRLHKYLMVALLTVLLLSACTPGAQVAPAATQPGSVPVDPIFREFYRALGGSALLGPAISALVQLDNRQCQYAANALMCYDPNASEADRFNLAALGRQMGMHDDPQVQAQQTSGRVVDGYAIYDEFVTLYDRLHGARFVGHPLTQVRINYRQNRVEQYFENVGFYRRLDAPRGQVQLISYGAYACQNECRYTAPMESSAISNEVEQIVPIQLLRIGGVPVFGQPLTRPFVGKDGNIEQVYEKAVFYLQKDDPNHLHLRPVPLMLGISFTLPSPKVNDPRMVFYPVQDGLGYNVPRIFDEFIVKHGGKEISGQPISDILQVPNSNLYRQCFQNYCLDYDPTASDSLRIRLAPIGMLYVNYAQLGGEAVERFAFSPETISLNVGEAQPQIAPDATQEIFMVVLQRSDQRPLDNIEADVTLYLPNGQSVQAHLPPTNTEGVSRVKIAPLPGVQNGSVIPYQVCLNVESDTPVCAQESYLIWDSR